MKPYTTYNYIYPPRPEYALPPSSLPEYDNGEYIAQPKLNGDCMQNFMRNKSILTTKRDSLTWKKSVKPDMLNLCRGEGWMCLVGEYMNKSKKNGRLQTWNDNFVIFDIIVFEGHHLTGTTFEERIMLLDSLYGSESSEEEFLYKTDTKNVYRVKSFRSDFKALYDKLVQIDMYEGVILKRANAELENGLSEMNNYNTQLKFRKGTKNYNY